MCIGMPARVVEVPRDGAAVVIGRQGVEVVDTRLVGAVDVGDWLLLFQGAARERIDAARAAEIDTALDLLDAALLGDAAGAAGDPGFALPSSTPIDTLRALAGAAPTGETR